MAALWCPSTKLSFQGSCKFVSSDSPTTTEGHRLSVTTRCCNYSLFELLMMGERFTRNMQSRLQGIKYCTKSAILLENF
jgi:hypothetical protein